MLGWVVVLAIKQFLKFQTLLLLYCLKAYSHLLSALLLLDFSCIYKKLQYYNRIGSDPEFHESPTKSMETFQKLMEWLS